MSIAVIPQTLAKPASSNRLYDFDFSEAVEILEEEQTISSATVTSTPSGLTVGDDVISGATVQVRVSGGTAGTTYALVCAATLSDGSTILHVTGKLEVY